MSLRPSVCHTTWVDYWSVVKSDGRLVHVLPWPSVCHTTCTIIPKLPPTLKHIRLPPVRLSWKPFMFNVGLVYLEVYIDGSNESDCLSVCPLVLLPVIPSHLHLIYTPANKVWRGGVYRNHPLCPSVCLSVCSHRVRVITSYPLIRSG